MKVKFKLFRFDPKNDTSFYFDTFVVNTNLNDRILDCLNTIRWTQDASLAYRMSCAHGVCGSCGMTINGVAALACKQMIKDYDYTMEIVIEPLKFLPKIKDLVVDMTPFFQSLKELHPIGVQNMVSTQENKERNQTIEEHAQIEDSLKCIMCACCTTSCPVILKEKQDFIGPASVLRAYKFIFDSRVTYVWDWMKLLNRQNGIWNCKTYFKCTEVCPKEIKVTNAILKTKRKIYELSHKKA